MSTVNVFNKIGFHVAGTRLPEGVEAWAEALVGANIPLFLKATDNPAALLRVQKMLDERETAVTPPSQPHTLIYQQLSHGAQDLALPDLSLAPEAAAEAHWQQQLVALPARLDKERVWLEIVHRPQPTPRMGDWLGRFFSQAARLALADGWRLAAGSYGPGEPDPAVWDTDGWLAYLELAQQHPGRLSIALQEYSLKTTDIWFSHGEHIGRFEKLLAACDKHQLKRPSILITEFGWTHNRIPDSTEQALADLAAVAEYYAQHPDVLGAALWKLGPGWGGIGRQVQKLIDPLTEQTLTRRFERDTTFRPRRIPLGPRPLTVPTRAAGLRPNGRFISDVTIPDDMRIPAGSTFTKTWRVENNGSIAWVQGFSLTFAGGTAPANLQTIPLPAATPGRQVDISVDLTAPTQPGTYYWDWRMRDKNRLAFGDILYARIIAKVEMPAVSDGRFVADVTIPDDTAIQPGTNFTKTWRVRNSGSRAWGAGFTLRFVGGVAMTAVTSQPLPNVAPGQEVDLSVPMQAPLTPGSFYGDWRLHDDQQRPFGHRIYVRIIVPLPVVPSLAPAYSQRDPLWINKRLGHPGSPKTIGEWGCLVTCLAMVASSLGKSTNPAQLNDAMVRHDGFLDLFITKFKALTDVYADVIYDGQVLSQPAMLTYIDNSLAAGRPVAVQVDFTSNTPYTDNDQHWVVLVGKNGDDYRINDPWLLPAQESSFKARYGRAERPLWESMLSALFYHPVAQPTRAATLPTRQLQAGMNVNPDAPHSNPFDNDDLKGLDWVRFVFKIDARPNPAEQGHIEAAFAQYDPIIDAYSRKGTGVLLVINQETIWGISPWTGNNDWPGYADQLAVAAQRIAERYQRYGERVAYQIWNEGDKRGNPASVFVSAEQYALVLGKVAAVIRAASPQSPIIFNGMATGPEQTVAYLRRCQTALGGSLPVDAVGIHPYTRWGTQAPFDWGGKFGTLSEAIAIYKKAFPSLPFWITEIGVAADTEIGPEWHEEIANYLIDVYRTVTTRHSETVPVLIWFAWSDLMRNAGIVDTNGRRKEHIYLAYRRVRNREL